MADSALPEPQTDLEYKTTKGIGIGYTPARAVHPGDTVTGTALTDEQRKEADKVVGSPAQGNGVSNEALSPIGALIDEVDSPSVLSSNASPSSTQSAPAAPTGGRTQTAPAVKPA